MREEREMEMEGREEEERGEKEEGRREGNDRMDVSACPTALDTLHTLPRKVLGNCVFPPFKW